MALQPVSPQELAMLGGRKLQPVSPEELAALNPPSKQAPGIGTPMDTVSGMNRSLAGVYDALLTGYNLMLPKSQEVQPMTQTFRQSGINVDRPRSLLGMVGEYAFPGPGGVKSNLIQTGLAATGGWLARQIAPDSALAEAAGAMTPQAAGLLAASATRAVARGGEVGRRELEANLNRTKAIMGEEGPLSSTLPGSGRKEVAGWLEKAGSYLPGAGFAVRAKGERIQAGMGSTLDNAAGGAVGDKYDAGSGLKSSLFDETTGYIGKFIKQGESNYDKVFSHWAPNDKLEPQNFLAKLREMSGRFSTSDLNNAFGDPRYAKWAEAVDPPAIPPQINGTRPVTMGGADSLTNARATVGDSLTNTPANLGRTVQAPNVVVPGRGRGGDPLMGIPPKTEISFGDAKQIRTRLGKLLSKPELVSGFDTAEIESLYSALSNDMADAARAKGGTALADWEAANSHWRQGRQGIAKYLDPIKNLPEERFFETIFSPTDGFDRLQKIKSMGGQEKWDEAANILTSRMGTPPPSKDLFGNIVPEKFSSETFLTNYNRMPDRNKSVIFGVGERRKALDELARAASDLRRTSASLANPSGTAGAGLAGLLLKQAAGAAVTLGLGDLATLGGTTALSYVSAKKLMDPKFARWLAQSTKIPPQSVPGHINRLRVIAQNAHDKELEAVADEMSKQYH